MKWYSAVSSPNFAELVFRLSFSPFSLDFPFGEELLVGGGPGRVDEVYRLERLPENQEK